MKKYKRVVVFIASALVNPSGNKIFWTSTYAEEFSNLE
jgi:hypothetical protein